MNVLLAAFGLVFVAELGDKSMLLAMTLATRYRWWWVLTAIAAETAVVMALAVAIGGTAGALLPDAVIGVGAGLLFIAFGIWTLRGGDDDEAAIEAGGRSAVAAIGAIALAMFLSEFGDKTQVATLSLSSLNPSGRLAVWAGATAGMVGADAVAIYAGLRLHRAIPERMLARAAAALFIVFGVAAIVFALR